MILPGSPYQDMSAWNPRGTQWFRAEERKLLCPTPKVMPRFVVVVVVVVVVVFTLTHGYNAVRRHRTGSNNSGAEDYLRRKTKKKQKKIQ